MIGSPDFVHEQNHDPRFQGPLERFSQNSSVKTRVKTAPSDQIGMSAVAILPTQTMHYYREIPQNSHAFALFDAP